MATKVGGEAKYKETLSLGIFELLHHFPCLHRDINNKWYVLDSIQLSLKVKHA